MIGIVLVNLAAFSVLAVAVVREVEARSEARSSAEKDIRESVVFFAKEIFASFFADIDFGRMPVRKLLEQSYWDHALDAYITNFVYMLGDDTILSGDVAFNPVGEYDEESGRLRQENFDLLERAYRLEQVQQRGDIIALPLYSGAGENRSKWGAAYIRLRVPTLPEMPPTMGLKELAVILGSATLLAAALLFLLLDSLVLKPLGRISEGARRVSGGSFNLAVEPTGRHDEIDELILSFNSMMQEVGQKREVLEKRVEEVVAKIRIAEQQLVLNDRLAAMGTLAAGIAHEINNPLGGMLNAVHSIRRHDDLPEKSDRYLRLVEDGLGRIREVVQRVLRFSPRSASTGEVVMKEVVEDASRFVSHRFQEAGAQLDVSVDGNLVVRGDPGALGQVFLNLFVNSLDAAGDEPLKVKVSGYLKEGWVHLEVSDNGRGMDDSERRKAFDLFYTSKMEGQGTGLGLSIVHQVVTEQGGMIEMRSTPGEGTAVHITLPPA